MNGTFIQLALGSLSQSLSCSLLGNGCIKARYRIRWAKISIMVTFIILFAVICIVVFISRQRNQTRDDSGAVDSSPMWFFGINNDSCSSDSSETHQKHHSDSGSVHHHDSSYHHSSHDSGGHNSGGHDSGGCDSGGCDGGGSSD